MSWNVWGMATVTGFGMTISEMGGVGWPAAPGSTAETSDTFATRPK